MPNLPVDMDSWGRSACYPRGTFYLLSYGPSIRNRRVTKACFRICSTHRSRSQAPFYLYALWTIANRPEGTFALLRYSLGGGRPSQTAQLALFLAQLHGIEVRTPVRQEWYFTGDSTTPKSVLHSLPPMLRMAHRNPTLACSKGPRGLSV